jgi:hypothetical protein
MSAHTASVSSECDILVPRPVQTSVQETTEVIYTPIAPADQSDLEVLIPSDNNT